jgi:UDP-GlcNAc:undecaprenyl-phosphate/decaprenyl-phosphate GlcNAc-1-phosphate transferase
MLWGKLIITGGFFLFFLLLFLFLKKRLRTMGTLAKRADQSSRWSASQKPTTGGIGFFVAFVAGWMIHRVTLNDTLANDLLVLSGATCAFAVGLWDDLTRLNARTKLAGQLLSAALLLASSPPDLVANPWLDAALKLILIVGMMNSINMLDNMDGVASVAALAVSGWFVFHGDAMAPAMAMTGAIAAFLMFNRPVSSMFMGDSGSLLLGYTMAFLFLHGGISGEPEVAGIFPTVWVLVMVLFAIPLADSLVVTINRIRHGVSPMQGGRDHTTHNLVYAGLSEKQVFLLFISLAVAEVSLATWFMDMRIDSADVHIAWWMIIPSFCFTALLFLVLWLLSLRNLRRGKYSYSK